MMLLKMVTDALFGERGQMYQVLPAHNAYASKKTSVSTAVTHTFNSSSTMVTIYNTSSSIPVLLKFFSDNTNVTNADNGWSVVVPPGADRTYAIVEAKVSIMGDGGTAAIYIYEH